jgi:hypothetical protein
VLAEHLCACGVLLWLLLQQHQHAELCLPIPQHSGCLCPSGPSGLSDGVAHSVSTALVPGHDWQSVSMYIAFTGGTHNWHLTLLLLLLCCCCAAGRCSRAVQDGTPGT